MIFSTCPGNVVLGFLLWAVSSFSSFLSLMPPPVRTISLTRKSLATSERVNQTDYRCQNHRTVHCILPSPFIMAKPQPSLWLGSYFSRNHFFSCRFQKCSAVSTVVLFLPAFGQAR